MASLPQLTRGDRAHRREKIIAAYLRGECSRKIAEMFSMSDGRIREIVREAGVARRRGNPNGFDEFNARRSNLSTGTAGAQQASAG